MLELALASGRSAHDCTFVAAAIESGIPLITHDGALLRSFPDVAMALESEDT